MPTGSARDAGRRWRDWFGRLLARGHRHPEDAASPDSAAADPNPGGSDDAGIQASLDQVLRHAAEARSAPPDGNG